MMQVFPEHSVHISTPASFRTSTTVAFCGTLKPMPWKNELLQFYMKDFVQPALCTDSKHTPRFSVTFEQTMLFLSDKITINCREKGGFKVSTLLF